MSIDLTDKTLWRRALSFVHPDKGGSEEVFKFLTEVKEELERQDVARTQVLGRGRERTKKGVQTVGVSRENMPKWWQTMGGNR